jgi:histidinol-phosphate aminotransferase
MPSLIRKAIVHSPEYPFSPVEAKVKLDQNESSEDFPAPLKQLVLERLAHAAWNRYPDLNAEALCRAIAKHDDWNADGIVAATGSNVLISLLIQMSALHSRVVTVKPNFALYGLDAKLLGAALTEVPLNADCTINTQAIMDTLGTPCEASHHPLGVVYVPRPHAPSGTLMPMDALEFLVAAAKDWLVVVDEAYYQFAPDNASNLAKRHPNVVLLRTFSKAWGLAGIRLGYALASEDIAKQLKKLVPPFAVSVMQSVCAEVALENSSYMHAMVAHTQAERGRLTHALSGHSSWKVIPSHANFLLIRTPDALQTYQSLLAKGVLVRRQDSLFGLEGCIRVSIGTAQENDCFLRAAEL